MGPAIILFDGDCAFCNGWVRWITRRDRRGMFSFTPLATPEGMALRRAHGVPETVDSIVLIDQGRAFTRSEAAWRVLRALPGFGSIGTLVRLIPRPVRDRIYDLIARNRHRLGLKDACEVPPRQD